VFLEVGVSELVADLPVVPEVTDQTVSGALDCGLVAAADDEGAVIEFGDRWCIFVQVP
jgi:hypothetical protein